MVLVMIDSPCNDAGEVENCYLSSFPGQISNLGSQKISQVSHFPGKPQSSAVVAMAGEKERGVTTSKSRWML